MRRVLALSLRIIRQFVRDRRSLALLFVVPLFVMTILNFVLNNTSSGVTLGVVPPQGAAGQLIVQQLRSRLANQHGVSLKTVDAESVDTTLKNGDADGVLIFPPDFATQLAGQTPALTLRLEGSNPGAAQQLRSLTALLAASLGQLSASATTAATPA